MYDNMQEKKSVGISIPHIHLNKNVNKYFTFFACKRNSAEKINK